MEDRQKLEEHFNNKLNDLLSKKFDSITLVVGPEGGFEQREIDNCDIVLKALSFVNDEYVFSHFLIRKVCAYPKGIFFKFLVCRRKRYGAT